MTVGYHAEFPRDIRRLEEQYRLVSPRLAKRFLEEVENGIESVKKAPGKAGHFVNTGSKA